MSDFEAWLAEQQRQREHQQNLVQQQAIERAIINAAQNAHYDAMNLRQKLEEEREFRQRWDLMSDAEKRAYVSRRDSERLEVLQEYERLVREGTERAAAQAAEDDALNARLAREKLSTQIEEERLRKVHHFNCSNERDISRLVTSAHLLFLIVFGSIMKAVLGIEGPLPLLLLLLVSVLYGRFISFPAHRALRRARVHRLRKEDSTIFESLQKYSPELLPSGTRPKKLVLSRTLVIPVMVWAVLLFWIL
jgi:hypothetical protein